MSSLDKLALGWGSRLRMVMQTEAAECGVACLAMIVGYHGQTCEITELRRILSVSLKGTSLKQLVGMSERLGFAARPVRLELDELRQLSTPCILHWDLHHFVVLAKVTADAIVIHDPAVGVRRLPMATVSRHFTGVALELTPVGELAPAKEPERIRLRSILGRVVGLRRSLGQLFALALAIEVFAVVSPLFMQWVVDHALVSADRDLLLVLALGFGMLLLRTLVSAMRGWIVLVMGASLKVQGRTNVFSHMINLPSSYFEARHFGDVVSRFCSQDTILQAITTDVVEAVLDGVLVSVTLAIMFLFAPTLTFVAIAGALMYGLLRWVSYTPLRQASSEAIVWGARRDSHVLETLRGVKTIKLFNGQDSRRAHWMNLLIEATNRQLTTQKLQLLVRTANGLLIGMLAIVVVWMGASLVLDKQMSIGMLLAFLVYKDQFIGRVSNLIDRAVELTMLRLHAERLADIALTKPEPRGGTPVEASETARPVAIEVRNLRFRYSETDPWVLDRVSFRIEPGETVAIVGASGCGKTTLLKILASLLAPTQGELLVDGQSLASMGTTRWRSMIGVVMQDDQLFAGSVSDNICFFADEPDKRRIEECARLAALHDEIAAMPMGYHTLIGDMGTVLSGGQKQRVLIARALYRQPGVLLLDEATSDLDVANEKLVNAAIRATRVTRIIIAHRPDTIRSADRVINLDEISGRGAAHLSVLPGAGRGAVAHNAPTAQIGAT